MTPQIIYPNPLFRSSVMSISLQPHRLQHTRPPCPSKSPEACWNSCTLNRWCHATNSSSVAPISPCLQSFPALRPFLTSLLFTTCGQSIGASASASVLPMNIQGWFLLGWTGLIYLQSKALSRVISSTTVQRHQFFTIQTFLLSSSHICTWLLEKP